MITNPNLLRNGGRGRQRLPNVVLREGKQSDCYDYNLSREVEIGSSIVHRGPVSSFEGRIERWAHWESDHSLISCDTFVT